MTPQSDDKIFRIEDYIGQIDKLVESFPTFEKYVEQNYSDKNIDACVDLLYELIENIGVLNLEKPNLIKTMRSIRFNPLNSKYLNPRFNKPKYNLDKYRQDKDFNSVISLGFDEYEEDLDIKPCFIVYYNFDEIDLDCFDNVTETLFAFFDVEALHRKEYPRKTKTKYLTDF